jgi:type IX secretion system PorP/SprF family membrane protein
MKKLMYAALALGISLPALGQQRPQHSQYMMNNYLLNPAVAGIENFTDVKLGMRRQWVGLDGAPITYYATAHTALGKKENLAHTPFSLSSRNRKSKSVNRNSSRFNKVSPHHGIGGMLEMDKMGPLSTKAVQMTYAYHQPITRSLRVSAGLTAGWRQFSLDWDDVLLNDMDDPQLRGDMVNQSNFDLAAGIWVYSSHFYLGASAQQLLQNDLDFGEGTGEGYLQAHYFSTAGVKLEVTEDFALVPSVMMKMAQPSPVSWDLNLKAVYADAVWAGLSYRERDAVSAMAGGHVTEKISVGYSYDFTTSRLKEVSSGSHEIVLGIKLAGASDTRNWLPWW